MLCVSLRVQKHYNLNINKSVCVRIIYEQLNQENGKRYVAGFFRYSADKTMTKPKSLSLFKSTVGKWFN